MALLDCLILGDSIAVGVGQARPGCTTVARTGITSSAYVQTLFGGAPRAARTVVISLGVNDDATMNTLETLRAMRRGLQGGHVTWLLPGLKDDVRGFIQTVAREHNDATVDTRSQVGADHLHPSTAGYRTIATWIELPGTAPPVDRGPVPASAPAPRGPSFPLQYAWAHPITATGKTLPTIQTPGHPVQWQSMPGAGTVYGLWPTGNASFAAIPPRDFAYRAMPTTTR